MPSTHSTNAENDPPKAKPVDIPQKRHSSNYEDDFDTDGLGPLGGRLTRSQSLVERPSNAPPDSVLTRLARMGFSSSSPQRNGFPRDEEESPTRRNHQRSASATSASTDPSAFPSSSPPSSSPVLSNIFPSFSPRSPTNPFAGFNFGRHSSQPSQGSGLEEAKRSDHDSLENALTDASADIGGGASFERGDRAGHSGSLGTAFDRERRGRFGSFSSSSSGSGWFSSNGLPPTPGEDPLSRSPNNKRRSSLGPSGMLFGESNGSSESSSSSGSWNGAASSPPSSTNSGLGVFRRLSVGSFSGKPNLYPLSTSPNSPHQIGSAAPPPTPSSAFTPGSLPYPSPPPPTPNTNNNLALPSDKPAAPLPFNENPFAATSSTGKPLPTLKEAPSPAPETPTTPMSPTDERGRVETRKRRGSRKLSPMGERMLRGPFHD